MPCTVQSIFKAYHQSALPSMQTEKSKVRMRIGTDDRRTQLYRQHIQSNGFTLEHTVPRSGSIHFQVMPLKICDHACEKRICYGLRRMLT